MKVYYGETGCQMTKGSGEGCTNKAYWLLHTGEYACGVHSKGKDCKALPKRSAKEKQELLKEVYAGEAKKIIKAIRRNRRFGQPGRLAVTKLRMRKAPLDLEGYQKVFPNSKAGDMKPIEEGQAIEFGGRWGMAGLSPMVLGPVKTSQPGVPKARNLENAWQALKVFPQFTVIFKGAPNEEWFKIRDEMYRDPIPHRHHPGRFKNSKNGKTSRPLYAYWILPDGTGTQLDYIESRQIYCTYYERLARDTPELARLRCCLEKGMNTQIIGYDGYDLELTGHETQKELANKFERFYLDPSRPFGHELMIAALLLLEKKNYPWTKHTTLKL
jgi:hypothetical protein